MVFAKWASEKLYFDIPLDAKLGLFRSLIAEQTGLQEHSFKLIHAGAVMKEDNAPLIAYKIKPNSVIAVVGSTEKLLPPAPSQAAVPRVQQSTISNIHSELETIRTLSPALETFVNSLQSADISKQEEKEHARLGELLLQALLRLDAIVTDGEWEDARRERKAAVKEVQTLLDRLDSAWNSRVAS